MIYEVILVSKKLKNIFSILSHTWHSLWTEFCVIILCNKYACYWTIAAWKKKHTQKIYIYTYIHYLFNLKVRLILNMQNSELILFENISDYMLFMLFCA